MALPGRSPPLLPIIIIIIIVLWKSSTSSGLEMPSLLLPLDDLLPAHQHHPLCPSEATSSWDTTLQSRVFYCTRVETKGSFRAIFYSLRKRCRRGILAPPLISIITFPSVSVHHFCRGCKIVSLATTHYPLNDGWSGCCSTSWSDEYPQVTVKITN